MIVGSTWKAKMKPRFSSPLRAPREPKTKVDPSVEYAIRCLTTSRIILKNPEIHSNLSPATRISKPRATFNRERAKGENFGKLLPQKNNSRS